MPVESPKRSGGWNCASEALAEIRAYPGELQTFSCRRIRSTGPFGGRVARQEVAAQHVERDALHGQIDRLASVASELAEAVAEQKKLVDQKKNCDGRRLQ